MSESDQVHSALAQVARSVGIEELMECPDDPKWRAFVVSLNEAFASAERERDGLRNLLERRSTEMIGLTDQLRREKELLTAVLAALSNGIVHLDRTGRLRYANRAFVTMLNLAGVFEGKKINELITIKNHMGRSIDPVDVVHKLEPGAMWRDEECSVSPGRATFAASVVISPVFDNLDEGKLDGFVISITDATERARNRARIRAAEIEVATAEQARQAQASFLANMSHELRTPLNAIIGYSELVAEEAEDFGYTEILGDLDRIQRSGRHLVTLISDVLDMSKIQAGKLDIELEEIELAGIIEEAVDACYPLVAQNRNAFETDVTPMLPTIRADSVRMMQALVNLIGNAGKFTSEGRVTVRAGTAAGGKSVFVEVEDTGIGIAEEKLESLFSPFTQADSSTTRRFGGTGLGLSITREVTEAMGGEIEVESTPGVGSTFRLVFPAVGLSEVYVDSSPVVELPPEATVETLLVIDDDRDTHALIRRYLAETDIAIHSSFSAEEGFKKAKEIEPELLFLDILLPGIDGWSMLEHWRTNARLREIPFFVMSGKSHRPRALREGARGFLAKPLEADELLDAVRVTKE